MIDYLQIIQEVELPEYPLIPVRCEDIERLKWIYHATHFTLAESIAQNGLNSKLCRGSRTTEIEGIYFIGVEPAMDHYQIGCQKVDRSSNNDFAIMLRVDVARLNNHSFCIDMTDEWSRSLWETCGNNFAMFIRYFGAIVYTDVIEKKDLELVGCHDCHAGLYPTKPLDVGTCPYIIQQMFQNHV